MAPWKRTFWIVYAANLITSLGMMSFLPFFPSYLEELGVTERASVLRWSGAAVGAAPLAAAVMGPIWGSIGDRFSRKLMVMRALFAIALFVGAMGFVRNPWELLALRLCQGVFSGFVPPSITLVSVAAPREVQGRLSGTLQGALALGTVLGPIFGGILGNQLGLRGVFFCVSGLATTAALLVGLFVREPRTLEATMRSFSPALVLRNAAGDLRSALRIKPLRAALLLLFCAQLGNSATMPQIEVFTRDLTEAGPERVRQITAWAFSAFAAAALFSTPAWGHLGDRMGHARALRLSALLGAASIALHAAVGHWALLLAARALAGMTLPGSSATAFGVVATETAVERRGSAMGVAFSARAFAMSFGAVGGGVVAAWIGLRGLFLAASALVVGVVLLAGALDRRREAARPQDVVGLDASQRER